MPIDPDNWPDDDPPLALQYNQPNYRRRLAALLARLRKVSRAKWLLVHDADEVEGWTEPGFRVVGPPADVLAGDAVQVLAWGELPEDATALLQRVAFPGAAISIVVSSRTRPDDGPGVHRQR